MGQQLVANQVGEHYQYDERILGYHNKTTLKNMAMEKGLTQQGFNGRTISRMRKQDFIDFLMQVQDQSSTDNNRVREQISSNEVLDFLRQDNNLLSENRVLWEALTRWRDTLDTDDDSTGTDNEDDQSQDIDPDQPPDIIDGTDIVDEETTKETRALECKICTVNKICVALTTCGHTFCNSCTKRFENKCATCRVPFTTSSKLHIFV